MLFLDWCNIEENKERGERLKREWTGFDEHGNPVDITKITYGSKKKMLWEDEYGHTWAATMGHRTSKNFERNCPECAKNNKSTKVRKGKTNYENVLSNWCLGNAIMGEIITSQWTGISKDGKHYTMDEVSYGSGLKMLWHDEFNHEWYATVKDRTSGRGCPHCNKRGTSYAEQYLYWSLKQLYTETENRCVVLKDAYNQGIEYDILVPDIPLAIEYSPTCWHKGKEERDNLKKEICNKCDIRLIQIIEDSYNEHEKEFTENYICIPTLNTSNRDEYLQKIVSYILNSIGHSIEELDIDLVKKNALDYSKKKSNCSVGIRIYCGCRKKA